MYKLPRFSSPLYWQYRIRVLCSGAVVALPPFAIVPLWGLPLKELFALTIHGNFLDPFCFLLYFFFCHQPPVQNMHAAILPELSNTPVTLLSPSLALQCSQPQYPPLETHLRCQLQDSTSMKRFIFIPNQYSFCLHVPLGLCTSLLTPEHSSLCICPFSPSTLETLKEDFVVFIFIFVISVSTKSWLK